MSDAPKPGDAPRTIDVRDLIGDPEDAPRPNPESGRDSPGTPGGTAGSGGTNKVQDDLDL